MLMLSHVSVFFHTLRPLVLQELWGQTLACNPRSLHFGILTASVQVVSTEDATQRESLQRICHAWLLGFN